MDTVWISHPKLGDRKEEVPASALPEHQRSGWELVDAPDRRPETIQALINGGWNPEEARKAVEAAMPYPSDPPHPPPDPDPDPGSQSTEDTEAPTSPAGASALPAESPQGRRASKGNK